MKTDKFKKRMTYLNFCIKDQNGGKNLKKDVAFYDPTISRNIFIYSMNWIFPNYFVKPQNGQNSNAIP